MATGLRRGLSLKRGILGRDGTVVRVLSLSPGQEMEPKALLELLNVNSYPGGLFPLIAHINHSCGPNAEVDVPAGARGNVLLVRAVRAIRRGQELTVSYTGGLRGVQHRRYLKDHYGFVCACSCCARTARERKRFRAAPQLGSRVARSTYRRLVKPDQRLREIHA